MQKEEDDFLLQKQLQEKKDKEIELKKAINYKNKETIMLNIEAKKDAKQKQKQNDAKQFKELKKVNFLFDMLL